MAFSSRRRWRSHFARTASSSDAAPRGPYAGGLQRPPLFSRSGQQDTVNNAPFRAYTTQYRPDDPTDGPPIDLLVEQLKAAKSDSDREKIKSQLKGVLETQFAARQERHKKEIDDLEVKVKKLKELFGKRQENAREIVANRLEQILRDAEGLGGSGFPGPDLHPVRTAGEILLDFGTPTPDGLPAGRVIEPMIPGSVRADEASAPARLVGPFGVVPPVHRTGQVQE